jgi:hypothetical protein
LWLLQDVFNKKRTDCAENIAKINHYIPSGYKKGHTYPVTSFNGYDIGLYSYKFSQTLGGDGWLVMSPKKRFDTGSYYTV